MTYKMLILSALFLLSWHICESTKIESNFYREEPCAKKNGFCVLQNECPGELSDELKSLCAMQKPSGAVCCQNINQEDVNCFQTHNECRDKCPPSLSLGRRGCPEHSVCCVLVS